jgi:hypothetical protein
VVVILIRASPWPGCGIGLSTSAILPGLTKVSAFIVPDILFVITFVPHFDNKFDFARNEQKLCQDNIAVKTWLSN